MQNIGQRVTALRKKRGWSQEQLAEKLGYSRNYISMIERGEKVPSGKFDRELEDIERRSAPLLNSEQSRLSEDPPALPSTVAAGPGLVLRGVPIISMAEAGELTQWDDVYSEDIETFAVRDPKAIGVRIHGDSMSPDYKPGTVAILYPSEKPRNDNLVVARLSDGSVLFKRLHVAGEHYHFISINPAYPPIVVPRRQVERCFPVGKTMRDEL